jgi:hypothetical protein
MSKCVEGNGSQTSYCQRVTNIKKVESWNEVCAID